MTQFLSLGSQIMVMFLSCTSQSYKNKGKKKNVAESSGLKNKTKQIKKKKKSKQATVI